MGLLGYSWNRLSTDDYLGPTMIPLQLAYARALPAFHPFVAALSTGK